MKRKQAYTFFDIWKREVTGVLVLTKYYRSIKWGVKHRWKLVSRARRSSSIRIIGTSSVTQLSYNSISWFLGPPTFQRQHLHDIQSANGCTVSAAVFTIAPSHYLIAIVDPWGSPGTTLGLVLGRLSPKFVPLCLPNSIYILIFH